eukprot:311168-Pelagomonas_calceolata.AAC.1
MAYTMLMVFDTRCGHHFPAHPAHTTITSNILPSTQNINLETTDAAAGSSPPENAPTIQASQPSPHSEDSRDGPPSKRTRSAKKQTSRHSQPGHSGI